MIGDPKQAIYGFRGGDVFTYLKAVNDANYHWSMDTNYRSTESVVNGYNTLFYGLSVPQYRIQDLQLWAQQKLLKYHNVLMDQWFGRLDILQTSSRSHSSSNLD
mgnify:CR=1 FL=1